MYLTLFTFYSFLFIFTFFLFSPVNYSFLHYTLLLYFEIIVFFFLLFSFFLKPFMSFTIFIIIYFLLLSFIIPLPFVPSLFCYPIYLVCYFNFFPFHNVTIVTYLFSVNSVVFALFLFKGSYVVPSFHAPGSLKIPCFRLLYTPPGIICYAFFPYSWFPKDSMF